MARSTASKALRRAFAKDYYKSEEPNAEARFEELKKQFPEVAGQLFQRAEKEAVDKIDYYKKLNDM